MTATPTSSDIDIIIVHYHAASLVRDAVAALRIDAAATGLAIRVFVVDNGSATEERELLQSLPVEYVPTGRDAGYAGGANTGFPATSAQSIVLMNEDIHVLPGCLRALNDALQLGAAVAGPEFVWDLDRTFLLPCTEERTRHNELIKASGRRNLKRLAVARQRWRQHARQLWRAAAPFETTAISGALLMFKRDTWETVGPWDAGYQMYFDENDWLFRVKRRGLTSVYVPEAKAIHLHNPKLMGDPDRAQWCAESFARFGEIYYGQRFMRRLLQIASRPPVIPEWTPLEVEADGATVEIDIPPTDSWPLWIELTPSPFGYPATATCITDSSTRRWRLPALRGLPFLTGTLFLQVVDDPGRELASYRFDRRCADVQSQDNHPEEVTA